MDTQFKFWMEAALEEARLARSDVPVGAVLLDLGGAIVATSHNSRESDRQLLGHAESNVILSTWGLGAYGKLEGFTLVTTLEPCLTCAALVRETGISRLIFGAANVQRGAAGSLYDVLRDARLGQPIEIIGGVLAGRSQSLLDAFFENLRG